MSHLYDLMAIYFLGHSCTGVAPNVVYSMQQLAVYCEAVYCAECIP